MSFNELEWVKREKGSICSLWDSFICYCSAAEAFYGESKSVIYCLWSCNELRLQTETLLWFTLFLWLQTFSVFALLRFAWYKILPRPYFMLIIKCSFCFGCSSCCHTVLMSNSSNCNKLRSLWTVGSPSLSFIMFLSHVKDLISCSQMFGQHTPRRTTCIKIPLSFFS